jgi:hypothetical protein
MSRSGESRDAEGEGLYCEIDGSPVTLLAEDLSTAGFFVQTKTPKAMDRELRIFVRSSLGELQARGQVVQVVDVKRASAENRRSGYGLLFTSLEDDQRAFIGLTLDALERLHRAKAQEEAKAAAAAARARPSVRAPSVKVTSPKPAPSHAINQIAAELRAELTKLQGKTAWTALGLEADSPLASAKEAFLRMSKRFHPHKFARHDSAEITTLATEVFIAYKRSYSVLTKLAPRVPTTSLQEAQRGPRNTITSIAPEAAAAASLRPEATKRAGSRPRSR